MLVKYNIIISIFIFLFLNTCNLDVKTNQKDIKYQSNKKELKSKMEENLKY